MLIAIQYRDGKFDMVKNQMLDTLISERAISLFRRQSGWVVVDRDTVRRVAKSERFYIGEERRSAPH